MLSVLSIAGEKLTGALTNLKRASDGSWIAIQTEKPVYYAGETVRGYIVCQINTPRQCRSVTLRVKVKEKTKWDVEREKTTQVPVHGHGHGPGRHGPGRHGHGPGGGPGEQTFRTVTEYIHTKHKCDHTHVDETIIVSNIPHTLMPGAYSYPFQYTLRPNLPGAVEYYREKTPRDPEWRAKGKKLETKGQIKYKMEAMLDAADTDFKFKNYLVVNSAFDWSKMQPAQQSRTGEVKYMCCINKGPVTLSASFDRAAYTAGETAGISAVIKNDSTRPIQKMNIRLRRTITLRDSSSSTSMSDIVCSARYDGVEPKNTATRDLPLKLDAKGGSMIPSVQGRIVDVKYSFEVECDLPCAPDIGVSLPMVIFNPVPTVWGMQDAGLSTQQNLNFADFPPVQQQAPVSNVPAGNPGYAPHGAPQGYVPQNNPAYHQNAVHPDPNAAAYPNYGAVSPQANPNSYQA